MRLLHTEILRLTEFNEEPNLGYVILKHGSVGEEVTFQAIKRVRSAKRFLNGGSAAAEPTLETLTTP